MDVAPQIEDTTAFGRADRLALAAFLKQCLAFLTLFVIVALPILLSYRWVLRSVGEDLSAAEISQLASEAPVLWNSAFLSAGTYLKLPMVAESDATVVAVGSSRVMQFRSRMFSKLPAGKFYSAGGSVQHPIDLSNCLHQLLELKPSAIILGLDFWWFQSQDSKSVNRVLNSARTAADNSTSFSKFTRQFHRQMSLHVRHSMDRVQLYQQAWRDHRFRRALTAPTRLDHATGRLWIGCKETGGFRNDGSYRYSALIRESFTSAQIRAQANQEIDKKRFHAHGVDIATCALLVRFLRRCKQEDIAVVALLPPVHSEALRRLTSGGVATTFWEQLPNVLRRLCRAEHCEFHDFSDPTAAGISDDQFIDWLHAADTAYAGMLIEIVQSDAESVLADFLDPLVLGQDVAAPSSPLDLYGD